MFDKLKTRKGRLEHKIRVELEVPQPSLEKIMNAVDTYHKDNVDTIDKLKKDKKIELKRINGALKQTINAHGPITKSLIGSAGKRIYGALIVNPNDVKKKEKKWSIKSILLGAGIATVLFIVYSFLK
jgi:hypothetical protein